MSLLKVSDTQFYLFWRSEIIMFLRLKIAIMVSTLKVLIWGRFGDSAEIGILRLFSKFWLLKSFTRWEIQLLTSLPLVVYVLRGRGGQTLFLLLEVLQQVPLQ